MPASTDSSIDITTRDGRCRSFVFHPQGKGPWPAVLVYMDGLGIRPVMLDLGRRLADSGYFVLLPDLFYRSGPYAPMDPHVVFSSPDGLKTLKEMISSNASMDNMASDTAACMDFLDAQPAVRPGRMGTTGYCMGGRMSLMAAGRWPDRVVASASFHGSNLATNEADSVHLLAPRMRARVYVAGATDDRSFPEAMKQRLETALVDAGVEHEVETYPAGHGWVFPDTSTYDEACAERHWRKLLQLFDETLGEQSRCA